MSKGCPTIAVVAALAILAVAPSAKASPENEETGSTGAAGAEKTTHHDNEGLFGPLRVGAFAGVGFPRPISVEGMIKISNVVGLGLEYSLLPNTTISGVATTFYAVNADLRIFPFENGFFIGMAGGKQHLGASTSIDAGSLGSIPEQVTVDTIFINPRIGVLWTSSFGLTLGIDAGVQIPLTASVSSTLPSQLSASNQVNDVAMFFGKSVLPTVDLLRVGLLL